MRNNALCIAAGLIFLLATLMGIFASPAANAQEGTVAIIRIFCHPSVPDIVIVEPDTAYIAPGAVVAWWNKGRRDAKVQFLQGKECAVGSSAPTGFRLESQKCYTTSHMPPGVISSLKFDEEGTFEFEVEFNGIGKKEGKIVVTKRR